MSHDSQTNTFVSEQRNLNRFKLIVLFFVAAFVAFVLWHLDDEHTKSRAHLSNHAQVISYSVWVYNLDIQREYLEQASNFYDYLQLSVYDKNGAALLDIHNNAHEKNNIDRLLLGLGLIQKITMVEEIYYEEEKIGTIEIVRLRKNIYEIIAVFAFLCLLAIAIYLYIGIYYAKKALEHINEDLKVSRQKAEAANQAKSIFLANMSHELRTPLNAILGFAKILGRDLIIGVEQREEIEIINRSGNHLLTLINDILDLAKIESGKTKLNETRFDLSVFLCAISNLFDSRAVEKGLSFKVEKGVDLPSYIKADEGKLRQVLINLLGNAMKFTKTGSVILRVKSCDSAEKIQTFHFEIEDTGIGIASDHLDKIFDSFNQAAKSVDETTGTGLGLAITRQFVDQMGGRLEVASKINKGSLFRFNIKIESADASDNEDITASRQVIGLAPGQRPCRILVVEDIKENRILLIKLLKSIGFEVQEAQNGKQGVEVFHSWHPDLIFMDIRMPVMDGYEATKQIKKTKAGQKTIIIAVTAHAFEEARQKILNHGCNDFIKKPFLEEKLFSVMEKHLNIKFIYEDQDASPHVNQVSRDDLTRLPAALYRELKDQILIGSMTGIEKTIKKIVGLNKDLAEGLQHIAGNYDIDTLLSLIEEKKV